MVHWGIACEVKNNCTAKDIATRFCISGTSVQRIMVLNNKALVHETQVHLPQHLMFDEIKGVGGYNFIWADADSHVLEALLPTRRIQFLESYFRNFPIEERQKVKTIVVDLNAAYISFIPKVFPNAQVIVDRFHIVNMVNRALNTTRKQLMKKYKHSSREYKVLKSYWCLFLKDSGKLEATKPMYQIHLGYYETQVNLIHNALELEPAFKETYWTYQQVLHAVHTRDSNLLKQTLNDYRPLHNEMDTTISTLKKNWSALLNSCRYEYSNGPLEGLNGKIKKIKKTSYGYRNFDNFKLRIYLECKVA
jgi:transposase